MTRSCGCSFSHACVAPGPKVHVPGTTLFLCAPHLQVMGYAALQAPVDRGLDGGGRITVRRGTTSNRRGWATYSGIVGG